MKFIGRKWLQKAFFCTFLCLVWLGMAGSECRSDSEVPKADSPKTAMPSVSKAESTKDNSTPKPPAENPKETAAPEGKSDKEETTQPASGGKPAAQPTEKQKNPAAPKATEEPVKKTPTAPAEPAEAVPTQTPASDPNAVTPSSQPEPAEKQKDAAAAETDTPKADEKPEKTLPADTAGTDPNTATAPADPNAIDDPDEQEDVFSPKVSTLVKINEAFETIFSSDFVNENGLVDYATLRRKRSILLNLAKDLDNVNPMILMSLSPKEKTAFWINTHNACILKLIVDHYPIQHKLYMITYPNNSIMQITGDWRNKHFFDIQGFDYKLEEIEQKFLLDRTKDPRILFALSYATKGGSRLRNEPYTAEKLDDQLDDQVRKYLTSEQGMKIDRNKDILHLSNLFTMYKHKDMFLASEYAKILRFRDHKPEEQAWLNFIRDYLSEEDIRFLEDGDYKIKFLKYDWELDEAK